MKPQEQLIIDILRRKTQLAHDAHRKAYAEQQGVIASENAWHVFQAHETFAVATKSPFNASRSQRFTLDYEDAYTDLRWAYDYAVVNFAGEAGENYRKVSSKRSQQQIIIDILRRKTDEACDAYRKASSERLGLVAAANAWDKYHPDDGVGVFSQNPVNLNSVSTKEQDARVEHVHLKAAYDYAVNHFVEMMVANCGPDAYTSDGTLIDIKTTS